MAPARLAADQAVSAPGYGIHQVRLDLDETQRLVDAERPGRVNDVLLAALHLAIAERNGRHGRACRRVAVLVPSNLRPPSWRNETVGNFSLPARISTGRRHRTRPAATLRAATTQTARKKRSGMGTGLLELLGRSHLLPLWAKEVLVALIPLGGNREMWFSAPARMPLGLPIGAVTVSGRLHLSFRYRHRQFGPRAAGRFAQCYLAHLHALVACDGL